MKIKKNIILSIIICLLILFLPMILHWNLMSKGLLTTIDTPQCYLPLRWLVYKLISVGHFPWWDSFNVAGIPLAAQPDAMAFYPPTWLFNFLFDSILAFNVSFMLQYGATGMFMWLFLRRLKISKPAALIGALAFMFCGFMIGHRVHAEKIETAIWLPAILWALYSWKETKYFKWLLWLTAFIALQLFASSMQFVLMTWMILGCVWITWTIAYFKEFKLWGCVAIAFIAGLALAGFQMFLVMDVADISVRASLSYDQFSALSFQIKDLWTIILPFLNGSQWHSSAYNGVAHYRSSGNFAEMAAYVGLAVVTLVPAAFWIKKQKLTFWLFFAIGSIALLFMLGNNTPFWKFVYNIPLINKFRVPSRYLFVLLFCISILGAFGFDNIISKHNKKQRRIAAFISGFFSLLLIIFLTFKGIIPGANWNYLWVKVPIFAAVGVYCFALFTFLPKKGELFAYAAVLCFLIDMSMFGFSNIITKPVLEGNNSHSLESVKNYFQLTKTDIIKPRVFNCFHNYWERNKGIAANKNIIIGVPTLDFYGALFLKEFGWLGHNPSAFYQNPENLVADNDILSMLNAKFIASFKNKSVLSKTNKRRKIEKISKVDLPPFSHTGRSGDKWEKSNIDENNNFCSPNGKTPAMAFVHAKLKKNTAYRFHIKAAAKNAGNGLRIDLSAQNYDDIAQEFEIKPYMLEKEQQVFEHVIETGNNIPENVLIRIFTFSKNPIKVKDFSLEELAGPIIEEKVAKNYKIATATLTENLNNCGYAWFPEKLTPTPSKWAALDWINSSPVVFNPQKEALIELLPKSKINPQTAEIEFLTNSPNSRLFVINNAGNKSVFMVISEVKYPGWQAFIDGKQTKYYRVNGLIGGVFVPSGKHSVTIKYRPPALQKGIISFGIGIILLTGLWLINRKKIKELGT